MKPHREHRAYLDWKKSRPHVALEQIAKEYDVAFESLWNIHVTVVHDRLLFEEMLRRERVLYLIYPQAS